LIVETINLTRIYRVGASEVRGVRDVNLGVEEGTFTVILGPSGSGKSTLLHLIGLLDRPTSGKVLFKGRDITLLSNEERRGLRLRSIGFVFQTFNLLSMLTALENVELPLALEGINSSEQRSEATRLLEEVGLGHRLNHKPSKLSVGEMQRVAMARALVNSPSLVIADEPTGELDSKTGQEVLDLLSRFCREKGVTVLMATHDERVERMSDRAYRLLDGVLQG
jgi:ABC-type lipoprotein export system ATPase subunit